MSNLKIKTDPPPNQLLSYESFGWRKWFEGLFQRLGNEAFGIPGYSVATIPNPANWGSNVVTEPFSAIIYVYNEAGGAVLAFSDGTNWRRVTDRAIVS